MTKTASNVAKKPTMRVAIYVRKSTEEGLDQEFNSLDAQRESCELYVASQAGEGWQVIPERFDDGGFSGATMQRPALQRLLDEVRTGRVQVVVVYKLDRLSRRQADFVALLQIFEEHRVAFISVTQHFNTATPTGRLMLNILICFAQFERENMIERVRDKVAATKRQGMWCGGHPPLGYDVAPGGGALVVNAIEAKMVVAIFALYQQERSLQASVEVLVRRGIHNKSWTSGAGRRCGGAPFSKSTLAKLLRNTLYIGQVRYRGVAYPGKHPPIIDMASFSGVQSLLTQ